jgi:signal peptidase I
MNRYLACFLSALFPGLGQWNLKKRSEALVFLGAWILWWILFVFVRLPGSHIGYLALAFSGMLLFVLSVWRALRLTIPNRAPGNILWMLLLVPLSLLIFSQWASLAIHAAGFRVFSDPSSAMAPTVQQNDRFMADMRAYQNTQIQRGSVVLLQRPDHVILMKRVIAIGGDTILGSDNKVILNGKELIEPYAKHQGNAPENMKNFGPIQIPQHRLFVMGDNRDFSLDSRSPEFGLIDESSIIGKPLYLITRSRNRSEPSRTIQ